MPAIDFATPMVSDKGSCAVEVSNAFLFVGSSLWHLIETDALKAKRLAATQHDTALKSCLTSWEFGYASNQFGEVLQSTVQVVVGQFGSALILVVPGRSLAFFCC